LLNAVLGVLSPERGCIRLDGADITRLPIERRGLGYVPQQLGLFPHLTVRDNLAYSARARRLTPAQFQPLVNKLVEATGIGALLDRWPHTLSGGERQRVCVVRALASQPRLVLLDEPFAALNETLRRELWWLMRELQQERGLTVLLITHDLTEAYFLADRVSVLLDGRVVQQGEKAAVYARPAAPEVARFLGVETLQPGRIVSVSDGLATVEVGTARLVAFAPSGATENVLVSIRGEDVIVQNDGAGETNSVRNRLAAGVVSVQPGSPLGCVELDAGFPLEALLTRPACEDLNLRPGERVTALIKASAVHLIPRKP
jgi:molybdopterin-binding protein